MKKYSFRTVGLLVGMLSVFCLLFLMGCNNKTGDEQQTEQPSKSIEQEQAVSDSTENNTEQKTEEKSLIMGIDDTFAPMGFRDENGELVGFDVDLANAVAKKMGREIIFQAIDWSMKENELAAGNIDLIWNGYTITPAREEKVLFSDPYLENRQVIVTLSEDIKTKEDLAGKVVAVQAESSALEAVNKEKEISDRFADLIEFPTNIEAFNDLEAGRTDAIVVDEVNARYYIKNQTSKTFFILEDNFGTEEYGIGIRKTDQELQSEINQALQDLKEDGTYQEIYSKWFSDN